MSFWYLVHRRDHEDHGGVIVFCAWLWWCAFAGFTLPACADTARGARRDGRIPFRPPGAGRRGRAPWHGASPDKTGGRRQKRRRRRRLAGARAKVAPPLRHRTRNFPKRADEILDGGSIYWVVNRVVSVRQRIEDIVEAKQRDGTRCTDLVLHPALVPVRGRVMKPFQGWRYLAPADAPPDEAAPRAKPCICRRRCGANWRRWRCYRGR